MVTPEEVAAPAHETIAALLTRVSDLEAQAILDRAEIDGLSIGLISARTIGAAVGIVMATLKVTQDEAFDLLRIASQNSNRKLRDVASDVVRTGDVIGFGS